MAEYKKLIISWDYESVKLNVEGIEELVLEGKAEIKNAEIGKGKKGIFSSEDAFYECLIKLEKEVNLSLKNVRIEEYCKDDEANETYGGINVDAIQGDYITYSFDTEPDVQCVAEYLHDMITSVKTPDKLGIQSQLFLNGNGKGDNSDSHHVIATVQGSKDSVLYLRE